MCKNFKNFVGIPKLKLALSLLFVITTVLSVVTFSFKDTRIFIDGVHGNYGLFALPLSGRYQICWSEDSQRISSNVDELRKFDVIILGGVPVNDVYGLSNEQIQAIISYVKDGGSVLLIGGECSYKVGGWDRPPFSELLPVDLDCDEGFKSIKVVSFMNSQFLSGSSGQNFEIQFFGFHNLKPKEGALVLLETVNGDPLFVMKQLGKGKVGALAVFDVDVSNGWDQALVFYPTVIDHLVTRNMFFTWIFIAVIFISCSFIIACIFCFSKIKREKTLSFNHKENASIWHQLGTLFTLSLPCLILSRGWFSDGLPGQFEAAFYYGAVASLRYAVFSGDIWYGWLSQIWLGSPIYTRNYPWYYAELPYLLASIFVGEVWAFKIVSITWLILAGWGIYKVGRHLNASYSGSLVAAIVYQFWGLIQVEMFQLGFVEIFTVYCLAPFAFLFLLRLLETPCIGNGILLGVFMGWMFLSRMEIAAYFTIGFLIYGVLSLHFDKQWITKRLIYVGISIIIVATFLSVWWIPYVTAQHMISRFTFKYEESLPFSSSGILSLIGRSNGGYNPIPHTIPAYDPCITAVTALPFSLAILTLIRKMDRPRLALGAVMLFSILFAMGPYSPIPVFRFTHDYVPLMNSIRTPGRFLLVYALPVALLAGNAITILETDIEHRITSKSLRKIRVLLNVAPAILMAALLLISIEAMSTPLSGAQFKSIPVPKDTEKAFQLMDEGSILLEIPPSAWPKIPGYHKNTYVQNMMFSSILHRYLAASHGITSVTGITAPQHAPTATLAYVNLLDYYISIEDIDSFMKTVELVPGIKYLLINNHWVNKDVIEKLMRYPTLKTIYVGENVTLLMRTNCHEGINKCTNPVFAYIGTTASITEIYDKLKGPIIFYHDNPNVWFDLALTAKGTIVLDGNLSDLITEVILSQKGIILQAENYATSSNPYKGWTVSSVFQPAQGGSSAGTWSNQTLKIPIDSVEGSYEIFLRVYFHDYRGRLKIQVNNETPIELYPINGEGFAWVNIGNFNLTDKRNILSITNDGSSANDIDAVGYISAETMKDEYSATTSKINNFLENGGAIKRITEIENYESLPADNSSGTLIYLSQSYSDQWEFCSKEAIPLKVNGLLMGWWINDNLPCEVHIIPKITPLAILLNLIPLSSIILLAIGYVSLRKHQ
jgi:uncharacterized membrane protein